MNKRSPNQPAAALPTGEVIAEFSEYAAAVAYVDKLIKQEFPAGAIAIVGKDLRTVERVRGKLSYARLAVAGASTGAWLGLIIGILFTSDPTASASVALQGVMQAVIMGAGIGMLFNVVRFSLTKNKRSWISQSQVVAANYQVQVPADMANDAKAKASATETI